MFTKSDTSMKTCKKCGALFKRGGRCLSCFARYMRDYRKKDHVKQSEIRRNYYLANKDKLIENNKKWRAANPEKVKESLAKWRAENKDYFIKWSANNRDRERLRAATWRKNNPEKVREINARYASANKEYMQIKAHKRRAAQRKNGGSLSRGITEKLYKLQRGMCACCGEPLGDDYNIDHIIPLALGGSNSDVNVQLLKAKCNRKKSSKHPIDYMQSKGFLL